ncbi:MAG TPA: hypothetical protein VFC51_06920, partial [Chloroflexota bacterium]|nr:hypothetical protein [Chloroflexota bacterium]
MIVPTGRLLAQALRRWQRAAGPYWMYVCAAPFLQPVPIREPSYRRIDPSLLAAIRDSGGDRPHVFVDRGNPESALALTPALMDAGLRVVPIAQRWVSADAVVPSAGLVASLLAFAPAVSRPDPACGYVFVLDGARRGMEGR